ncbi:MAG: FAD-dependent oxidoreductase [Pseudomonadota bacterium]
MNIRTDFIGGSLGQILKSDAPTRVVVVGGGPVGVRMAQEMSRRGAHVILFNAERWRPYNRVQLTPLLAGEAQIGAIHYGDASPGPGQVDRYDGVSVIEIDREARRVRTSTGRIAEYDALVLATGSRAFVPTLPGTDLSGVFVFRNLDDAEALVARAMTARRVAVIGGGLLGLEAARGMVNQGAEVTVIEHENRLMPRQLDEAAGEVLKDRIEAMGTQVLTGVRVEAIEGEEGRVTTLILSGGNPLDVDTVIFCTGVRANTQLGAGVGLRHGRGIQVDSQMRTSDAHVYAIGECAEHEGTVYGLVGPGFEQVLVAADAITGVGTGSYPGSTPATKLKVLGAPVFSMGDFESVEQMVAVTSLKWEDREACLYRRIFVRRGRLVAALGIGDWPEATRLQQAVKDGASIGPWARWTFRRYGHLWAETDDSVSAWSQDAIVCNCTGVTKGAISQAIGHGAATVEDVRSLTSANTVCGTCKPLVQELLGQGDAPPEPVRWWQTLLWASGAVAILALATLLLPRVPMRDTFVIGDIWFNLWFDGVWKQWSGYILLGLTVAAAGLGLRRRIGVLRRLGGYDSWRIAHLIIGVVAAIGLFAHTGFRLGSGLNFWLMASFSAALILGALAGLATGGEHKLLEKDIGSAKAPPRTVPHWVHVIALWPLPVLLAIHILSVYSY